MKEYDPWPALTPFDPRTMIQSLDQNGYGLRAVFYRPDEPKDRWGHVIGVVRNGGRADETAVLVLPSLEGTVRDGWPASPPLQNLSIEQQERGSVALAVGMANQCHWSASIEAIPNERRLIFDLACHVNSTTEPRLRSSYMANRKIRLDAGCLALLGQDSEQARITFGQELQVRPDSGSFGLEVAETKSSTVRWKYTIDLLDASS